MAQHSQLGTPNRRFDCAFQSTTEPQLLLRIPRRLYHRFMQGCVVAKCTITLDPKILVGYVYAAVAFCTDGRRPRCQFHASKPVFSFLRQLTAWHCPHLLLRAVLRRGWLLSAGRQSVDISCSPGPQQQTRSSGVRRTTDRRTDTVP